MFPEVDYWQECMTDCDDGDSEDERAGWVLAFARATATRDGRLRGGFLPLKGSSVWFPFFTFSFCKSKAAWNRKSLPPCIQTAMTFVALGCKIRGLVILRKMKMSKVGWGGEARRVAEDMSGPVMVGI